MYDIVLHTPKLATSGVKIESCRAPLGQGAAVVCRVIGVCICEGKVCVCVCVCVWYGCVCVCVCVCACVSVQG